IYWLAKIRRKAAAFGVGFIIGGALGNTIDRIAYGWVVDFLDFSGLHFPYVFNVADMAVNLGVGLLIYDAFFGQKSALQAVSHTNF
ncbi:MAG: signal peptidase II, partial [Parvularculaceae bacterium]